MNGFFQNLKARCQQLMIGRYGTDDLSRFLLYLGLTLMILSLFRPFRFLSTLALLAMILADVRMFSRQCVKRHAENQKFLRLKSRVTSYIRFKKQSFQDRKTYKYYTCAVCHQRLRVPKGKGKIRINCPKCKNSFIKKT